MHDLEYDSAYIYFEEDYYSQPKEIFKFVANEIERHFPDKKSLSLLDVGCARGEFIYYLLCQYPRLYALLTGVDLLQELIDSAQAYEGLKAINFYCISSENYTIDRHYDVITMLGLVSALTSTKKTFNNAALHQSKGGKLFILGRFNHTDADVKVYYKNHKKLKDWQATCTYSLNTIADELAKSGYKIIQKTKFELPFELEERVDDPLRSWTLKTEVGTKFVNGLGLIFDLDLIVCERM